MDAGKNRYRDPGTSRNKWRILTKNKYKFPPHTQKKNTTTKHKHKKEHKNTDSSNKNDHVTFFHKNNIKHAQQKKASAYDE